MSDQEIINIIKRNDLRFTTRRKYFSLFSNTCVLNAYVHTLNEKYGISFGAMIAVGTNNMAEFAVNEKRISDQIKTKLRQNKKWADKSFADADKIFFDCEMEFNNLNLDRDSSLQIFTSLVQLSPRYFTALGLYNAFWRYFEDKSEDEHFTSEEITVIGKRRQQIAELYPDIEKLLRISSKNLGRIFGVDGGLLPWLTVTEMCKMINENKCSISEIILNKRRKCNISYAIQGSSSGVIINKKTIGLVNELLFPAIKDVEIITGHCAYPGSVAGKVVMDINYINNKKGKVVFVTNMTEPKDGPLLRKFDAVVTDQGGILSHASIFAREMKIPSVISTKIATHVLRDGDIINVDADKGIVNIIKRRT